MTAPTCSGQLRERLHRLGIHGQVLPAFLAWARRAGYLDPFDHYSDHDLAGRVAEFAGAGAGAPAGATATLSRGRLTLPASATRPEPAKPRLCYFPPPAWEPPIVGGR